FTPFISVVFRIVQPANHQITCNLHGSQTQLHIRRTMSGNWRGPIVGLILAFALALVVSANSFAQSTGTLRGGVSDSDGGVVPDVLVVLRNSSIGFERMTRTDHDGLYQFAGVAPGTYRMEVQATGFRLQVVDEIAIETGRMLIQDFHLEIGS